MSDALARIEKKVRERLDAERGRAIGPGRTPRDIEAAFRRPGGPHVIAEVKLASPSEGDIAPGADPVAVAGEYLAAGAAALSILTERDFFKGSPDYLRAIRARFPDALLLMKDFVVDELQLDIAREIGADAVLLIVALVGPERLPALLAAARERGLSVLVEVHDEAELAIAARSGARLIGVNNRNLKTLAVSLDTSERLASLAPKGATLISESGISTGDDVKRLGRLGFHGFLVGTSLMKTGKPGAALAKLLGSAR
jgi:indole-3-glycerol phosphate synthase